MLFSTKIIAIGGILVLFIFAGLFILISSKEPRLKYKQTSAPAKLSVESPKPNLEVIFKEKSLPNTAVSFFKNINQATEFKIETLLPPTGAGFFAPTPTMPVPPSFVQERQEPVRALSDYEVFAILHPSYYLKYLSTIEDLMIQDGVLKQEEKQVFDSEDKVIAFLKDKVFDYMVMHGIATAAERPRFERGLEVVQELHQNEAKYLRAALLPSPVHQISALWEFVSLKIVQLFLPYARAQGECYRGGASTPTQGSNLGAICCNCSIKKVPVGCLNAVCLGRPAIWDSETFICGCGL